LSKNFQNKVARIISTLFVPPSFTIIIFTFLAFYLETESIKIIVTLLVAYTLGFAAPIILFFILRRKKLIVDSDASIKEERALPFSIAIIFYLIGLLIFIYFDVNIISIAFWICYISNTIITIFINRYWKISAHAMGAAGPFAALVFLFGLSASYFLIIIIFIGWARIKLKCHTFEQVAAGTILAFVFTYVQVYFITKYFS
jgi:membrane-associated phospholipid phosphatase